MLMEESRKESIQNEACRAKSLTVENYKAGDIAGAKEIALKAYKPCPTLCGLLSLNAVLDEWMGFWKNINTEVDWYDILSAYPSAYP